MEALALAFWGAVMEDLLEEDATDVLLWLHTGRELAGFLWWCDVTGKERPEEWREYLLRLPALRGTRQAQNARKRLRDAEA